MEHLRLKANGASFHVARTGRGPLLLLLLHGWPESWLTWTRVMVRETAGEIAGSFGRIGRDRAICVERHACRALELPCRCRLPGG